MYNVYKVCTVYICVLNLLVCFIEGPKVFFYLEMSDGKPDLTAIAATTVITLVECAKWCRVEPMCLSFTTNLDTGDCSLFSDVPVAWMLQPMPGTNYYVLSWSYWTWNYSVDNAAYSWDWASVINVWCARAGYSTVRQWLMEVSTLNPIELFSAYNVEVKNGCTSWKRLWVIPIPLILQKGRRYIKKILLLKYVDKHHKATPQTST